MKKTTTPFTAQLVTFETSLPIKEVIARLDLAINKAGSAQFLPKLRAVTAKEGTTKEEIAALVNNTIGDSEFLYFFEMNHDKWLNIYDGTTHPSAVVYTIGNPIIAQTIMEQDIRAGYNIPPRLMILEKADGTGTSVVYHLPSSVMVLNHNPALKAAAEALDARVDELVTKVTAE